LKRIDAHQQDPSITYLGYRRRRSLIGALKVSEEEEVQKASRGALRK